MNLVTMAEILPHEGYINQPVPAENILHNYSPFHQHAFNITDFIIQWSFACFKL